MKFIKNLRPNTIADIIGVILIAWTISPALLIGEGPSLNSIIYRFLTIPAIVANTILIPVPEGLGGLAAVLFNVLLLIGIIIVFVLLINKGVYKTASFAIIWWALLLILLAAVSMRIDMAFSSQKYANDSRSRTNMMNLVEVKTEECILEPSGNKQRVTCNITLYNMPTVTNNSGVLIYLRFAENPTANDRYSLGLAPFVIVENTGDTYQGTFTVLLREGARDHKGVYIEGIEMHDGFDKYFTSTLKHPLY